MSNTYRRSYYVDAAGRLAPKASSTGPRIPRPQYPPRLPVVPWGQIPPGHPVRSCPDHPYYIEQNWGCPGCRADRAADARAVAMFAAVAGITELPAGASIGSYTATCPLQIVDVYEFKGWRVKPATDGTPRVMARDVWLCSVCGAVWHPVVAVCNTCGQAKGRKDPTAKARQRWEELMAGSDVARCEVCGFRHLPPAPKECCRCHHILRTPATMADIIKHSNKAAKPAEQTRPVALPAPHGELKEATMAKVKEETKKAAAKAATPKAAAKLPAPKPAKAAKAPAPADNGPKFLERAITWWESKATRFAFYLVLINLTHKRTDEEIFDLVQERFPSNGSISENAHVGWARGCLKGNFTSNPCPKYIPNGTLVPERFYLDEATGKRTTVKPAKEEPAPKPAKAAKAAKAPAPAVAKAAKRDAQQAKALAAPPAPKKLPPTKAKAPAPKPAPKAAAGEQK